MQIFVMIFYLIFLSTMMAVLQYLNSIYPLPTKLNDHLKSIIKSKTFEKKEFLLKEGQVCENIYFIEQGLARCFYLHQGTEVSSWFMKEGDMIISVWSFLYQQSSYEFIQALQRTTVRYINYNQLQVIYSKFPEFNYIGRVLTERYYALSEQRLYSLRMQRAQDRYEFLMQNHPELIRRVPLTFIASYLGITKETLSRIRALK